jgi:hypothetical protein
MSKVGISLINFQKNKQPRNTIMELINSWADNESKRVNAAFSAEDGIFTMALECHINKTHSSAIGHYIRFVYYPEYLELHDLIGLLFAQS